MKGTEKDKGGSVSFEIDANVNELLMTLYPIASLKQLALCYHMIMETNDGAINIANCKRFFQVDLKNYDETDMQRFNLTCCSNDQVMASFANPQIEETMNAFAEMTLQQYVEAPGSILLRLSHEEDITENEIKAKVAEFLEASFKQINRQEAMVIGSIILISTENSVRYIYMFNIDNASKSVKIYRTRGRKPADEEILVSFSSNADVIGYSTVVYEDIPRNSLVNNYPDILLAFVIQRMMTEAMPFEQVLKQLTFNSLPFIYDEGDMTGENTENNGGTNQQLEDDDFEEIGLEDGNVVAHQPGQRMPGVNTQEESEDIDFDDDDFDDIVDEF